jgi:hypothetical protein
LIISRRNLDQPQRLVLGRSVDRDELVASRAMLMQHLPSPRPERQLLPAVDVVDPKEHSASGAVNAVDVRLAALQHQC